MPTATPGSVDDAAIPADSLTGQLLIAMPSLTDRTFSQTVVFLCAHSPTEGAMVLVVNRRLPEPGFDDLLAQLEISPAPPRRRITLCSGGPLESSRGFVLHSADWSGDGSLTVDDDVVLTASLDVLREIAGGQGPKRALLALGHATWGPGQLENEIRRNAWLSAPSTDAILFGGDHDRKWRRALATLGVDPLRLVGTAGNA
ncbi:MAG: YqgE/AlgH family protein [Gluconacetobacter diazotrophicus]|nr:YqgE/AlgH family protein [Gluconacetobacter diazotrophicus]